MICHAQAWSEAAVWLLGSYKSPKIHCLCSIWKETIIQQLSYMWKPNPFMFHEKKKLKQMIHNQRWSKGNINGGLLQFRDDLVCWWARVDAKCEQKTDSTISAFDWPMLPFKKGSSHFFLLTRLLGHCLCKTLLPKQPRIPKQLVNFHCCSFKIMYCHFACRLSGFRNGKAEAWGLTPESLRVPTCHRYGTNMVLTRTTIFSWFIPVQ